ncbi:hypothetical protein [Dongshaea marina]|uniref:hypothetical protein n=1 Tax=Dongshaea marina TaxID=2047966 RepID=UPI000D3ECE70|nr:hypothetical protein [Dongshaea marina]
MWYMTWRYIGYALFLFLFIPPSDALPFSESSESKKYIYLGIPISRVLVSDGHYDLYFSAPNGQENQLIEKLQITSATRKVEKRLAADALPEKFRITLCRPGNACFYSQMIDKGSALKTRLIEAPISLVSTLNHYQQSGQRSEFNGVLNNVREHWLSQNHETPPARYAAPSPTPTFLSTFFSNFGMGMLNSSAFWLVQSTVGKICESTRGATCDFLSPSTGSDLHEQINQMTNLLMEVKDLVVALSEKTDHILSLLQDMYNSAIMKPFFTAENHVSSGFDHYQVELKEALFQQGGSLETYIPQATELNAIYDILSQQYYQNYSALFDSESNTGTSRPYVPQPSSVNRYFETISDRYYAGRDLSGQAGYEFKFRHSNPDSDNPGYHVVTPYLALMVQEHLTRTLTSILKWHQMKLHALAAYEHYHQDHSNPEAAEVTRKLVSLISLQEGFNEQVCQAQIEHCIEKLNANLDKSVEVLKEVYLNYAGISGMNVVRNSHNNRVIQIVSGLASKPVTHAELDRYTQPILSIEDVLPTLDLLQQHYPDKSREQLEGALRLQKDLFAQIQELTGMTPVFVDPRRSSDNDFLQRSLESKQDHSLEEALSATGSYIYSDLSQRDDVGVRPALLQYNHLSKEQDIFRSIVLSHPLADDKRWMVDVTPSPWNIPYHGNIHFNDTQAISQIGAHVATVSVPELARQRPHYLINSSTFIPDQQSEPFTVTHRYSADHSKMDIILKPTYIKLRNNQGAAQQTTGSFRLLVTEDPRYQGVVGAAYVHRTLPAQLDYFADNLELGSYACTGRSTWNAIAINLPSNKNLNDVHVTVENTGSTVGGHATEYVNFDKVHRGDQVYLRANCLRSTVGAITPGIGMPGCRSPLQVSQG